MSYYLEKIADTNFDFDSKEFNINSNDISVFFELDSTNFPNIYVWGFKPLLNYNIKLCLFL